MFMMLGAVRRDGTDEGGQPASCSNSSHDVKHTGDDDDHHNHQGIAHKSRMAQQLLCSVGHSHATRGMGN